MISISDADLHAHLKAHMAQRGIRRAEIERTLNEGWKARDAKSGTIGKVFLCPLIRKHGKVTYLKRWKLRYTIK